MVKVYTNKIDGTQNEFNCYTDIPMKRKIAFVANVMNMLTSGGYFNGIAKEMFFDYEIIREFTDVNTDLEDKEDAIGFIEDIVYNTDIVEQTKTEIAPEVLTSLDKAVNDNIAYRTGIHVHPIEDAIAELVSGDWLKDAILNVLNNANDKLKQLDMDALTGFMSKIKDMPLDFTPDKVIEAYMSTDAFKGNQAERERILELHRGSTVMKNDNSANKE